MTWDKVGEELRREWREHPVTAAYLNAIALHRHEMSDDVMLRLGEGTSVANVSNEAGKVYGLGLAIHIAEAKGPDNAPQK